MMWWCRIMGAGRLRFCFQSRGGRYAGRQGSREKAWRINAETPSPECSGAEVGRSGGGAPKRCAENGKTPARRCQAGDPSKRRTSLKCRGAAANRAPSAAHTMCAMPGSFQDDVKINRKNKTGSAPSGRSPFVIQRAVRCNLELLHAGVC
jgi:hypothetical protein